MRESYKQRYCDLKFCSAQSELMTKMGCVKRTQQLPNIYLYLKPKIKEVNTSETLKLKA